MLGLKKLQTNSEGHVGDRNQAEVRILGRIMRCPIRKEHRMVEVAPELFQCPHCGYGPSQGGYRPYWALSSIDEDKGVIDAVSVRLDEHLDCYVMTCISWAIDDAGGRIEGTFEEDLAVYISTQKEIENAPLPVIIRAKGKWDYPPAKPKLRPMMFDYLLGPKEIALAAARRGKS